MTVVVLWLGGPALADGPTLLAEPHVVTPPSAAPVDWTGPYAGLAFGGAWSDGEAEIDRAFGFFLERDVSLGLFPSSIDDGAWAAFGSVNAGYNVQRGRFIGGIEVDLGAVGQANDIDFSRVDPGDPPPFPGTAPLFEGVDTKTSYSTSVDALGSLRLRAGFAQDRNLFFATAGLAAGRVENRFTLDVPEFPAVFNGAIDEEWSEDGTRHGYILGVGMERRLTDRLSIKGEVMYYDLEDVTIEARSSRFEGEGIDYEFENDGYVARIGINLSF